MWGNRLYTSIGGVAKILCPFFIIDIESISVEQKKETLVGRRIKGKEAKKEPKTGK